MMIIRSAVLAATFLSAACVAPPPVATPAGEPASVGPIPSGSCEVKVDFASIGTGIDSATLQDGDLTDFVGWLARALGQRRRDYTLHRHADRRRRRPFVQRNQERFPGVIPEADFC